MAGLSKAQQVEAWNHEHPVGSKVVVYRDNGEVLETTVRFEAQLLGGHSPVAWVHGISGCYDIGLDHELRWIGSQRSRAYGELARLKWRGFCSL